MRNPGQAESGGEPAELAGRRWAFGPAVLDERSLELEVSGKAVKLERKPLEVLLYLLHHAGEVVTKDDLAEALWPGRILTETVLTRCISLLRQALQDDARTLIRTVHGFGYRLVADVRVEVPASDAGPPALDYRPGDHPPLRPQWKLVERLGTGGHGEAWLARHEKTGDARVFKFALDARSLTSLKREITLYRLLHDSLGPRAAVARIFEWNLAEAPYFIEMEYVPGGNLQTWSEAQGGLAAIPLTARLELAARIAEALAAAHSVGALHKDLKPGNVLIHTEDGVPLVRLCDFGSGGVLDPHRLDALGITRQGFTKTMSDATSATPLYVAPEVIAGQPFTVQADIYSLGVLLYQLIAGDLRKALAPGWESDVPDELLREDIAAAAAGNPGKRLSDAAQLAERLRTLEQRRSVRATELVEKQRAERARRILAELRRTRVFAVLLLVLAASAVFLGFAAFRARNEAIVASASADAISSFLMEDVLRIDSGLLRPSETSYEALLNQAAAKVGTRLGQQPKAAGSIHWLLGRRFQEIGRVEAATTHYEKAVVLLTDLYGRASDPTLMALDRLAWAYLESGRVQDALAVTEETQNLWESRLAPNDLAVLVVRARSARTRVAAGSLLQAEKELRAIADLSAHVGWMSEHARMLFKQWLGITPAADSAPQVLMAYVNLLLAGNVLDEIGEGHQEAESRLRGSLATFEQVLGEGNEFSALAQVALASVLASSGAYEEAEQLASKASKSIDALMPAEHYGRAMPKMAIGRLRFEQQRFLEATESHRAAVDLCTSQSACPPRVRTEILWDLGRAYDELGEHSMAIQVLQPALAENERLRGPSHHFSLKIRITLADALRKARRVNEATGVLSALDLEALARLNPHAQTRADFLRAQGLLFSETRQLEKAAKALKLAWAIFEHRLGASHWRTRRAHLEWAAAAGQPATPRPEQP